MSELRRVPNCTRIYLGCAIVVAFFLGTLLLSPQDDEEKPAPQPTSALITRSDARITDTDLGLMIDERIPADTEKLLIFTQCFAGNFAEHPSIKNLRNTAIASADKPDKRTAYGGYHDDAARELKPGDGRTAELPHAAGVAGKYPTEEPYATGTLGLADFSLADTSPAGEILGRYVLIVVARPDTQNEWVDVDANGNTVPFPLSGRDPEKEKDKKRAFQDTSDRDVIKASFAGKHNTFVTALGGSPNNPDSQAWDAPATLENLTQRIRSIGQELGNVGAPGKWQLIVFVSDHGEPLASSPVNQQAPPNSRSSLHNTFKTLRDTPELRDAMARDPENRPGFSVFLSFKGQSEALQRTSDGYRNLFSPGDFALELTPQGGNPLELRSFSEIVRNTSADGVLGNESGEGLELFFSMEESDFLARFLGTEVKVILSNASPKNLAVESVAQHAGALNRIFREVPERTSWVIVAAVLTTLALLAFLILKRFRRANP